MQISSYKIAKESVLFGFKNFKKYLKFYVLAFLLYFAIELLLNYGPSMLGVVSTELLNLNPESNLAFSLDIIFVLLTFVYLGVSVWYSFGYTKTQLELEEKIAPSISKFEQTNLKTTFLYFVHLVVWGIIQFFCYLPFILMGIAGVLIGNFDKIVFSEGTDGGLSMFEFGAINFGLFGLSAILLCIGFFYSCRLGFSYIEFVDAANNRVIEPIKTSYKVTKGKVWQMVLVTAYFILPLILALLPLAGLGLALIYNNAKTEELNIVLLVISGIYIFLYIVFALIYFAILFTGTTHYYKNYLKK
jgi:hypothetical protein